VLAEQARNASSNVSIEALAILGNRIVEVKLSVENIRACIQHQKQLLSVHNDGSLESYHKMRKDQFLAYHLNLNAIQERIIAMLRACKFELTNLDCAY
jgi:hypothetical protein